MFYEFKQNNSGGSLNLLVQRSSRLADATRAQSNTFWPKGLKL